MTRIAILAATALLSTVSIASADYTVNTSRHGGGYGARDSVDQRQYNQQKRIQEGTRSGEINRYEYQKLQAEQARIAELERRAKADGYVDPAERARLRQAQNEASRNIYQEKHDNDRRGQHSHGHRPWWRWY